MPSYAGVPNKLTLSMGKKTSAIIGIFWLKINKLVFFLNENFLRYVSKIKHASNNEKTKKTDILNKIPIEIIKNIKL